MGLNFGTRKKNVPLNGLKSSHTGFAIAFSSKFAGVSTLIRPIKAFFKNLPSINLKLTAFCIVFCYNLFFNVAHQPVDIAHNANPLSQDLLCNPAYTSKGDYY